VKLVPDGSNRGTGFHSLKLLPYYRGDKSGFPLKDCGNDNFNIRLFYANLVSKCFSIDLVPKVRYI
jgi:hypothetical protein